MLQLKHKLFFLLFNYSGTFCFTFNSTTFKFEISRAFVMLNFLNILQTIFSAVFFTSNMQFYNVVFKNEMAKFSTVSIFSSNVFLGVTNSTQILAIFLGIMQWWKRNEILIFLNSIIVVQIDSKSKSKLEKMIVRSCTSIMIYFIVICIINFNLSKVSLFAVLGLYVLTYTVL